MTTGRLAMEFETPEALKDYLKDHPGADPKKHKVVKKKDKPKSDKKPEASPHQMRDKAEDHAKSGRHDLAATLYMESARLLREQGSHDAAKSMDDAARSEAKKWKAKEKKKKSAASSVLAEAQAFQDTLIAQRVVQAFKTASSE